MAHSALDAAREGAVRRSILAEAWCVVHGGAAKPGKVIQVGQAVLELDTYGEAILVAIAIADLAEQKSVRQINADSRAHRYCLIHPETHAPPGDVHQVPVEGYLGFGEHHDLNIAVRFVSRF